MNKPIPKVPLKITAIRKVLPFIKKFYKNNGYMPSNREIAEAHNFKSPEWGRQVLRELEKQKFIKVGRKQFRAITLMEV